MLVLSSCSKLMLEHKEAANIPIRDIDFIALKDGDFEGYYPGGMQEWRENSCLVSIEDGRVNTIQLTESKAEYTKVFLDTLYNRVIRKQSLQVDAVSGATLDSKACLKSVENALEKALINHN